MDTLKIALCWGCSAVICCIAVWVHSICGFGRSLHGVDQTCITLYWDDVVIAVEAVCRSAMVVALVGFLWELGRASQYGLARRFIQETLWLHKSPAAIGSGLVIGALALMVMVWASFEENYVPRAVMGAARVCEFSCIMITLTALIALFYDFGVALATPGLSGKGEFERLAAFTRNFLMCVDDVESQISLGVEAPILNPDANFDPVDTLRTGVAWAVFAVTMLGFILEEYSMAPAILSSCLSALVILCCGGLACMLTTGFSLRGVTRTLSGKAVANLVANRFPQGALK